MQIEISTPARSEFRANFSLAARASAAILLALALLAGAGQAQERSAPTAGSTSQSPENAWTGARAFPQVILGAGRKLEYVGAIAADGTFRPLTKFRRFVENMAAKSGDSPPTKTELESKVKEEAAVADQIPPGVNLRRNERLVENVVPPARAVAVERGHSGLGNLRDSVVSFAYGAEKLLKTPQSITTDSRQRVIVSDAAAHAVHVLAYAVKDSFRIVGGPGTQLQSPSGVAVDRDDNIYVSDPGRGVIVVFDSEGRFIRDIGSSDGEGQFERPTGIAIDRKTGHLYVLDTPRHLLYILDTQGKLLARIGQTGDNPGFGTRVGSSRAGEFKNPTAVVVANDGLIVLDKTRIQFFDLEGKFVKQIWISGDAELPSGAAPGLCTDIQGNIYVSNPGMNGIRVYNHDGQSLGAFGRPGLLIGEFEAPAGMWSDSTGRVYIADLMNSRIQIFQFTGPGRD